MLGINNILFRLPDSSVFCFIALKLKCVFFSLLAQVELIKVIKVESSQYAGLRSLELFLHNPQGYADISCQFEAGGVG